MTPDPEQPSEARWAQGSLDRAGPAPLWLQLRDEILAMINRGGMVEGDRLPSESKLCDYFNVSRIVVRQAMARLVSDRLVERQQGRGAFVAAPPDDRDFISRIIGFSDEMRDHKRKVARKVLSVRRGPTDPRICKLLEIDPQTETIESLRILSVDAKPRFLVRSIIPANLAADLNEEMLREHSLYALLRTRYSIFFTGAERWIEAINADREQAAHLAVAPSSALLSIESRSHLENGTYAEYFSALYRTDQARLHFMVKPDG